jgi:hypothetical protein
MYFKSIKIIKKDILTLSKANKDTGLGIMKVLSACSWLRTTIYDKTTFHY